MTQSLAIDDLLRTGRKRPIYTPGPAAARVALGRAEIERMVPHRPPFLFLERISSVDLAEGALIGHRRIDPADPVLSGHFPGDPVYPGVLLLETMSQLAICIQHLIAAGRIDVLPDDRPPRLRLLRVHHALFLAEVRPGDELTVLSRVVEDSSYTAITAGQILREAGEERTICAMAVMEAYLLGD